MVTYPNEVIVVVRPLIPSSPKPRSALYEVVESQARTNDGPR